MNSHVRHAFASSALVASFALGAILPGPWAGAAGPQQSNSPIERLNQLEQRVTELDDQLAKLKSQQPAPAPKPAAKSAAKTGARPTANDLEPKVAQMEKQLEDILLYLSAQAESAKRLAEVLEESRAKGFTYGINPDSRVVMLAGFGEFLRGLQSNVPAADGDGRVATPSTRRGR